MRMVFLSTVSTSVIVMFPPESASAGEVPKEEPSSNALMVPILMAAAHFWPWC